MWTGPRVHEIKALGRTVAPLLESWRVFWAGRLWAGLAMSVGQQSPVEGPRGTSESRPWEAPCRRLSPPEYHRSHQAGCLLEDGALRGETRPPRWKGPCRSRRPQPTAKGAWAQQQAGEAGRSRPQAQAELPAPRSQETGLLRALYMGWCVVQQQAIIRGINTS